MFEWSVAKEAVGPEEGDGPPLSDTEVIVANSSAANWTMSTKQSVLLGA